MDTGRENSFVLYLRSRPNQDGSPKAPEKPILICSSYAEARYLQRAVRSSAHECVIRYVGESGGGD